MDAHSFRCIGQELANLLAGARVEKIHSPQENVFVFTVFAGNAKRRLILCADRQRPKLFFSDKAPANPVRPSGLVMRLRKYAAGRRLGRVLCDYVNRRIAFSLPHQDDAGTRFLLLDLREGPSIVEALPDGFADPPAWPPADVAEALCNSSAHSPGEQELWQRYPVLTPLLRETLAELDVPEGKALLVDLEAGEGELFCYADRSGTPAFYTAWPLPAPLLARKGLVPGELPVAGLRTGDAFSGLLDAGQAPASPSLEAPEQGGFVSLAVSAQVDGPAFFANVGRKIAKEESRPGERERKRLSRLLDKLDQEEIRLQGLLAMRADACLLRDALWQFPADARMPEVQVSALSSSAPEQSLVEGPPAAAGDASEDVRLRRIVLDPLLTVRENMLRMFRRSAKGKRGLGMLQARREETRAALERQTQERLLGKTSLGAASLPGETPTAARPLREVPVSPAGESLDKGKESKAARQVARFISSDGFVILRGKNAAGNQAVLKMSKPHDLWLHAEDGPSAHAVIRRAHAAEEVPEQTLHEAAVLVGQKSWQRFDAKVRIMVALARHVRPVKGAAPGTVHVDSVLRSIVVPLRLDEN